MDNIQTLNSSETNNLCIDIKKIKLTDDKKKYYNDYYHKNRDYILSRREERIKNGKIENEIEIKEHRKNNKLNNNDSKEINRNNAKKYYEQNRDLILAKRKWKKIHGTESTKDELLLSEFYKEHKKNNKWIEENERIKYKDDTIDKKERYKYLQKNRKDKIINK